MLHGNVAMYIMVAMAAYGAVTATSGMGGMAAVERMQGWGRQLGLTPLTDASFIAMKALVAVIVASFPIAAVFLLGWLTGAEATGTAWALSALIALVGAVTFSLYGLAIGLAFRTEAAVSAGAGMLVVLSFLGNLFFPLTGAWLAIAKFTPLYGYAYLARYPVNEGRSVDNQGNTIPVDPLWMPTLNVVVWSLLFAVLAVWLVRRGRSRQ
jgi:ABC-2 type transport system permease protein